MEGVSSNKRDIYDDKNTIKTVSDEYISWLSFANAGMLHAGNIYTMNYAIENLPSNSPVLEIGIFCGLSTYVIPI